MCIKLLYSGNILYSVINKLFQYTNTDNVVLHGDHVIKGSRNSSVSVVSGYGLDDRTTRFRSPAEARGAKLHTISETHPASCPMGTGGSFPGINGGRGVTLNTHPHLVA
jgi:hypothetical protein